jgi:hypothetical protein
MTGSVIKLRKSFGFGEYTYHGGPRLVPPPAGSASLNVMTLGMKGKKIQPLFWLLFFILFTAAAQAQDSLKVLLGKKVIYNALCAKGDEPAICGITTKMLKAAYSNVTVNFGMLNSNTVYKNSIQVFYTAAEGNEKTIEAPLEKGQAVFSAAAIKKMLLINKTVSIRLVQSPANPRMSIPTRIRNLLTIKAQ